MLLVVDTPRLMVLLPRDNVAVLRRKAAVVLRAHATFFTVDAPLLPFDPRSFARRKLPIANALTNAILLVFLARVYMMALITSGLRERSRGRQSGDSSAQSPGPANFSTSKRTDSEKSALMTPFCSKAAINAA